MKLSIYDLQTGGVAEATRFALAVSKSSSVESFAKPCSLPNKFDENSLAFAEF